MVAGVSLAIVAQRKVVDPAWAGSVSRLTRVPVTIARAREEIIFFINSEKEDFDSSFLVNYSNPKISPISTALSKL